VRRIIVLIFFGVLLCGCTDRPRVYNVGDAVYIQLRVEEGKVAQYHYSFWNDTWEYVVASKSCPDGCSYLQFQIVPAAISHQ